MQQQIKLAKLRFSRIAQTPFLLLAIALWTETAALPLNSSIISEATHASHLNSVVRPSLVKIDLQTETQVLELGKSIEHELGGGKTHSYQTTLATDQFLHVVVMQRDIDVIVSLFGPDGNKLAEIDSPNGVRGTEPIFFITEAAGNYRLEVRSPEKNAAAGRYEVKVVELKSATAQDRVRVTAYKIFLEGDSLRSLQTKESLGKAIEKFQEAFSLWQAANDNAGEADTLGRLGGIYSTLSETKKALEYNLQELSLRRAIGDRNGEGITLNNIGVRYFQLDEYKVAGAYFEQARACHRETGNRFEEVNSLSNLGAVHAELGDRQKALDYFHQALTQRRSLADRAGEAATLSRIGGVHYQLGDYQKSLDYYNQSLLIRRELNNRRGEAITLANIAAAHAKQNEKQKAIDFWKQALPLMQAVGDQFNEIAILQSLGAAHSGQQALDYLEKALQRSKEMGDRKNEAAILDSLGDTYSDLGEFDKARLYLDQALALHRASGRRDDEAYSLRAIAQVERERGNLEESRARIEEALKIVESLRGNVAIQDLRASYLGSKHQYYRLYTDVLMRLHQKSPTAGHDAAALQANERARARSLLELLAEARADIRVGVAQELLTRDRELRQRLNTKASELASLKNRNHSEDHIALLENEIDTLRTEIQTVEAEIRRKSPGYLALTQPQPLTLLEIQQQVLDGDSLLLEYSLGDERSYLWAVTPNAINSYELPKRAEVEELAQHLREWLTARNRCVSNENEKQMRTRIANADAKYAEEAARLSKVLLGPVAAQLGSKRLLIVADGALQYLPFAALPVPRGNEQPGETKRGQAETKDKFRPLIIDHEIITLPSASAMAVLRRELAGRTPAPKALAVVADPVFAGDDERFNPLIARTRSRQAAGNRQALLCQQSIRPEQPMRLIYSRQEADRIAALLPANQSLKALDFRANREMVASGELSRYRIVHFSTHGFLDTRKSELSALVLSLVNEWREQQDGYLRAHEIYNLNLPAELVVLSACETGLGKEFRGEGLVGLTRGFMYAGARRVVVSLWSVNDAPTADLMVKFYRGMLKEGLSPAAALRQAQIEMWKTKRLSAPFFWAGFVLQGEWR